MAWRCQLFESRQAIVQRFGFVPVGAMWPVPAEHVDEWVAAWAHELAPRYLRERAAGNPRPPVFVKLPDGSEFCLDHRAYSAEQGFHGDGWAVAGDPPACTVTPSVNVVGRWHGYLTAGVLTDDCEGRTFPDARGIPEATP